MTEQEARETICPKYKAAILANFNKDYCPSDLNKIDDIKCDASDCMRWPECLSWWIEHERGNEPIRVMLVEEATDESI
jgi:hypothetical protein